MGRLIDIDVLFDYFGNDAINETTRSNIEYFISEKGTVEAIPKDQYEARLKENNELINDLEELRTMINKFAESYENRLKADMVAILKEISTTIEEEREDCEKLSNSYERFGIRAMAQRSQIAIQQKINNLQVNNSKVN